MIKANVLRIAVAIAATASQMSLTCRATTVRTTGPQGCCSLRPPCHRTPGARGDALVASAVGVERGAGSRRVAADPNSRGGLPDTVGARFADHALRQRACIRRHRHRAAVAAGIVGRGLQRSARCRAGLYQRNPVPSNSYEYQAGFRCVRDGSGAETGRDGGCGRIPIMIRQTTDD